MLTPTEVTTFRNKSPIHTIDNGYCYTTLLLADGSVYAMGDKRYCGQSLSDHAYTPVLVVIPLLQQGMSSKSKSKIVSVCCSDYGTIVGTNDNQWFAFGDAEYAKNNNHPGYGKAVSVAVTSLNDALPKDSKTKKTKNIKKIVATCHSYMLLTDDYEMYGVGTNKYGELGLGHEKAVATWQKLKLTSNAIVDVQAGGHNFFAQSK